MIPGEIYARHIRVLCGYENERKPFERESALFDIVAHLSAPRTYYDEEMGKAALHISFASQFAPSKRRKGDVQKLRDASEFLIDWEELKNSVVLCSLQGVPTFELAEDAVKWPKYVARIVQILIASKSAASSRDRLSINKAVSFLNAGGLRNTFKPSSGAFSSAWPEYKPILSFVAVNEFGFNRRLSLNPERRDFTDLVDDLLREPETMRTFFAKAKFVQERLEQVLDRRTFLDSQTPDFPSELTPIDPNIPRLSAKDYAKAAEQKGRIFRRIN